MEIETFEYLINLTKKGFRELLEEENGFYAALLYAKRMLILCESKFEEDTMIENFREVASKCVEEKLRSGVA